jgi:hypothetical protein
MEPTYIDTGVRCGESDPIRYAGRIASERVETAAPVAAGDGGDGGAAARGCAVKGPNTPAWSVSSRSSCRGKFGCSSLAGFGPPTTLTGAGLDRANKVWIFFLGPSLAWVRPKLYN